MYIRDGLALITILLICSVPGLTGESKNNSIDIFPGNIMAWETAGEPEVYTGDDLFLYINGGADIYQEYGFEKVSTVEYKKKGAGRISVEIYSMNDPVSAFGIFTFKTGGRWSRTIRGNLYSSEDYYLNILLGETLITITSISINKMTGKGIEIIRNKLEEKEIPQVFLPDIIKYIDPEKYKKRIYFKGDLGLMNIYNLFSADSGILQGSSGINKDGMVILLEFNKEENPFKRLDLFIAQLKEEERYSDFTIDGESASFSDREKRKLFVSVIKGYVLITIEKTLTGCNSAAKEIKDYISTFK